MRSEQNSSLTSRLIESWTKEINLMQQLVGLDKVPQSSLWEHDRDLNMVRQIAAQLRMQSEASEQLRKTWGDKPLTDELRGLQVRRQGAAQATLAFVQQTTRKLDQLSQDALVQLSELNRTQNVVQTYARR